MTTVADTPTTTSKAALQRVLTERDRPPRPSVLSSIGTFAWRAMISFKHAPEQLLDVLFMPIIGLVMSTSCSAEPSQAPPRVTCSSCCRESWCRTSS